MPRGVCSSAELGQKRQNICTGAVPGCRGGLLFPPACCAPGWGQESREQARRGGGDTAAVGSVAVGTVAVGTAASLAAVQLSYGLAQRHRHYVSPSPVWRYKEAKDTKRREGDGWVHLRSCLPSCSGKGTVVGKCTKPLP